MFYLIWNFEFSQAPAATNTVSRNGIVGAADSFGSGMANFGNAQASAFEAILKGVFNAFGNFIGGMFGSGTVSGESNAVPSSNKNGQAAGFGGAGTYVVLIFMCFIKNSNF